MLLRKLCGKTETVQYSCHFSTKPKTNLYSQTVNLPKTQLPLRLDGPKLIARDQHVHKLGRFDDLYQWQKLNLNGPEYVIHDGPPYANGSLHMGHAINKILKDTILRYKILLDKRRVDFVPGWDCHGLPIELKSLTENKHQNSISPLRLRAIARKFADKTLQKQMETFKKWGIIGAWSDRYETKSVPYIDNQIRQFFELYKKGFIYRDIKPIYWSPSSRTALAESELIYNQTHQSPSVYLRIRIENMPNLPHLSDKQVYAIVWTTTPWTLPMNQAICYNVKLNYCLIKRPNNLNDPNLYVIALDLLEQFSEEVNCLFELLGVHSGGDLFVNATYVHPISKNRETTTIRKFFHSEHVTNDKGTGLVHTAPAHGHDDFLIGLKHQLNIEDVLTEDGQYKLEMGEPFAGKYVLTDGNTTVIDYLDDDLIHQNVITHSYPYDWRTNEPVIIKASKQWFIDTKQIKTRALAILEQVNIMPEDKCNMYKRTLRNLIDQRPYWCISRQRKWGVPIPVFYQNDDDETIFMNSITIDHICDKLHEHGPDFWWKLPLNELLPSSSSSSSLKKNDAYSVTKGEDILDIWFDSGISWSYVLKNNNNQADLVLEGFDQFNGWFQSSLLTSVALQDRAPFKTIYVHGFAVDKNGMKMSKSLGNVVDPDVVMCGNGQDKPYGIDVLRWWVACHANQMSLASVSENTLNQVSDEVQKIRSVLRFAIGSLNNYEYEPSDFESAARFSDRYILHLLLQYYCEAKNYIDSCKFHKINAILIPLLTNQISAQYLTTCKDRLYCDPVNGPGRRAVQYTLLNLFHIIAMSVGGILPHLIEECYSHLPQRTNIDQTFFTCSSIQEPQLAWNDEHAHSTMEIVQEIRREINQICGGPGVSLKSTVSLTLNDDSYKVFEVSERRYPDFRRDLSDICQVAQVNFNKQQTNDIRKAVTVTVELSGNGRCPRCRLQRTTTDGELCDRCHNVMQDLTLNQQIAS